MDRDTDWLLLERWFAGECSSDEAAAVQRWIEADAANARVADIMRAAWQRAGGIEGEPGRDVTVAWSSLVSKLRAESPQPTLRLLPPRRRIDFRVIARIAAVLLLAVGGVTVWQVFQRSNAVVSSRSPLQQVSTATGQRASVSLSDGTRVLLGVASHLRFAPTFGRTRDVYLDGEAFFEVAHDSSRPFVVHTSRATTRVLGTKFDVRAYGDSPDVSVLVAEGAVALKASVEPRDSLILHKADLGQLYADGRLVRTSDADAAARLAWMRGELVFDRTPVPEAVRQLARWYGADVRLGDSALVRHAVTASLGGQSLSEAVRTIAATLDARVERRGVSYVLSTRH